MIDWPRTWRTVPLWSMFQRIKDVEHPHEELLSVYRAHGVVKKSSRDNLNKTAENRNIYQLVDEGWLVVNRMKAWQGSVGISPYRGIVSGHYICFRPTHGEDPRFLNWLLRSPAYTLEYSRLSRGVRPGQIEIDNDELKTLPIRLPPLEEQRRIADFLDAETARIDVLVSLRLRQVGLLKIRQQEFIRELFTEKSEVGGISWLGGTPPKDWPVVLLSRVARTYTGTTFPHSFQGNESGDFPFIKVADFARADVVGRVRSAQNWVSRGVARELGARIVPSGSVLYARVGAALLLNQRRITTLPSIVDDNVRGLHVATGDPRYWSALLSLLDLGEIANPGPVPSVSDAQVRAIRVPCPSPEEQIALGEQIEQHARSQEQLIGIVEQQIALLGERREALITAAVTGQLDVTTARR